MRRLAPVHPGAILTHEFLAPLGMEPRTLGQSLGLGSEDLNPVLAQAGSLTAELAIRLARYFGTTPEFWLNLQVAYDLAIAQDRLGTRIAREVTPFSGDH